MSAGADPSSDSPPPAGRKSPQGLLAWYYSTTGTLIRIALYALVIGLVLAWRMGWIWQPVPTPTQTQTLDKLELVGWKKKRWQSLVPDNLPIGQLPFIEVTVTEPPVANRGFGLQNLADGLHLFSAAEPHVMLSWPVGVAGGETSPAAVDEAVQPRAFNGQWVVSFLIRPDQLATLPESIWLVYLDPSAVSPDGAAPQLKPMAILTPSTLKATEPPKIATAPTPVPVPPAPSTRP